MRSELEPISSVDIGLGNALHNPDGSKKKASGPVGRTGFRFSGQRQPMKKLTQLIRSIWR
jgi:hypothetical protein